MFLAADDELLTDAGVLTAPNAGVVAVDLRLMEIVHSSALRNILCLTRCFLRLSQVYLYSAFQQQGTQGPAHKEKHYNDTENPTTEVIKKNKVNRMMDKKTKGKLD
ncbi:hypothetical protein AMECASPLE_023112 [Ameca splendens]|uniref:Uncharacterized protein n=1 Tax=Ameca splendens TaxID=208324 RepID=A0ABV0XH15_9TELE